LNVPAVVAAGQLTTDKHFVLKRTVSHKGKGLIMKQQMGEKKNQSSCAKHVSAHCCSHGAPNIDEKAFFGMSRRDFLMGLGTAGVGALAVSSCQVQPLSESPFPEWVCALGPHLE